MTPDDDSYFRKSWRINPYISFFTELIPVKRFIVLACLLLFPKLIPPVLGGTIDFGRFESSDSSSDLDTVIEERTRIWAGTTDNLQLETGILDGELVTIGASSDKLFVNRENEIQLLDGDIERNVPGEILLLDYSRVPDKAKVNLLTVTYLSGDQVITNVYFLRQSDTGMNLRKFNTSEWMLMRPVGRRMVGQKFNLKQIWNEEISTFSPRKNDYVTESSLSLPVGARAMSLLQLKDDRWIYIGPSGKLTLSRYERELASIPGDFGAIPHLLEPVQESWSRTRDREPVRLAPEYLPSKGFIAVLENPPSLSGFLRLFGYERNQSSVKLFAMNQDDFVLERTLGPFDRTVLDLEVPPANPDQLLILRRTGESEVALEMIDFS